MAKENVARLSDTEKVMIDYLRKLSVLNLRDLYNQLDKCFTIAKLEVSKCEGNTGKIAVEKHFSEIEQFLKVMDDIIVEREKKLKSV